MKKICWVTSDPFVDCDFNLEIISLILEKYLIHWIILLPVKDARFIESNFLNLKNLSGLSIEFLYWNSRSRNLKMLFFYDRVYCHIKNSRSDIVYLNDVLSTPFILPLVWRLDKNRTIFVAHDGGVKPSFKYPLISTIFFKLAYSCVKYVNMFSNSQFQVFKNDYPKHKVFIIPLALKDFGSSFKLKRTDNIIFFFFGSIHKGKNLGLLIDAACQLSEEGIKGFKISINGYTEDWKEYQNKIRIPKIFELNINKIKNFDIPDLFQEGHFMIFPYSEMSQSGALKVAFNYNIPVITSNLIGFLDEVVDGLNGYIFENGNVDSLKDILILCINQSEKDYDLFCNNMKKYTETKYSSNKIADGYIHMFTSVVEHV